MQVDGMRRETGGGKERKLKGKFNVLGESLEC
jgi:hypothetical protein